MDTFSLDPATGYVREEELIELSEAFVAGANEAHSPGLTSTMGCPSVVCASIMCPSAMASLCPSSELYCP
jgi:hypothetical protein